MINNSVNVGVNVGVKDLTKRILILIEQNPGINANELASFITDKTKRTIERYIGNLKESGKIEFRGADKTGGYYIKKGLKKKHEE